MDGGGLLYWPEGPETPPVEHVGSMADTALFGDNHGMFHQVAPIGPFDGGTRLVTPSAILTPADEGDATGDWVVTDHGEVCFRAPLDAFRVSVLWKADVYATSAERDQRKLDTLSMDDVADVFNDDLRRHRQTRCASTRPAPRTWP